MRDGIVFMFKLWLDSLKDIALSIVALLAIIVDYARASEEEPYRFKNVKRIGKRFDHWLDLYGGWNERQLKGRDEQE